MEFVILENLIKMILILKDLLYFVSFVKFLKVHASNVKGQNTAIIHFI